MSACRSCGAEVIWAFTSTGRRMPVDAAPTPDGNVVLMPHRSPGHAPTAAVLGASNDPPLNPETPRYTSHFATCPHANEHRRTR